MLNHSEYFEQAPKWFGPRMALGYSIHFLFVGLYLPYFPLWLSAKELSPFEISTILSMSLVIRVLASGQLMTLADRQKDRSNLLSALYVGAAIAILLYIPSQSFWPILAVTLLYNVFFNPVMPLLDAITLSGVSRFGVDYGKIRNWGSLVFIVANLGGGALLVGFDAELILYALIAAMVLGAALSFALPRIGRRKNPDPKAETVSRTSLLSNRRFMIVMFASGLAQASHAFLYGFGSIHWQAIGFSGALIGALWAIGVIAEMVLFQFSTRILKQLTPLAVIAIGCVGGIVRWLFFPIAESEFIFFALQILHGLSFGALHIGTMHFIMHSVREENIGAAQGVGYVLGGAAMGVAVFLSGPIYGAIGVNGFWFMSALCFIALISLYFVKYIDNQPQSVE